MNKLKALWASVPHPAQALIVAFASGVAAAAAHAYEDAGFHMSYGEFRHLVPTFIAAGAAAARVLYMVPSRPGAVEGEAARKAAAGE